MEHQLASLSRALARELQKRGEAHGGVGASLGLEACVCPILFMVLTCWRALIWARLRLNAVYHCYIGFL